MKLNQNFELPLLITKKQYVLPGFQKQMTIGRKESLYTIAIAIKNYQNKLILVSEKDVKNPKISLDNIFTVGVLCKIEIENRLPKNLVVNLSAIKRVQLIKPYLKKECFFTQFQTWNLPKPKKIELTKIRNIFRNFLKGMATKAFQNLKNQKIDEEMLTQFVDTIIQNYPNNKDDFKQKALEAKTLFFKYKLVSENIKFKAIDNKPDLNKLIDSSIDKRVKNRFTTQQREFYLREKLNAIREELGENDESQNELNKYLQRIEKESFPKYIKNRIYKDITKLKTLSPNSAEKGILKTHVDWLMSLPWYQKSIENTDIDKAFKILNKNHFGLEEPKKRIIEHLASSIYSKNITGQIICLVGPPGTGKTSLGVSIAQALGRRYVRIALGGVKDESEIRGHRRTYLGSFPGKVIQAMKKAQTINPVILIDEIDKLSSDYRGDPSSAMLEVLDPEQNCEFIDNYIEEPYDLSKVMFIATANYEFDIPEPLHDRMEVIHLSSYTEIEKTKIAKSYLIGYVLKSFNLTSTQVNFTVSGIREIIKYYTRESGVRELKRLITKICRKFIVDYLIKKTTSLRLTATNVSKYLGKRLFEHTLKLGKSEVGVTTGLAYTQYGGDILSIEATLFGGSGRLTLTGKLGKVMQESAEIAFNYIRSNAKKFNIKNQLFLKNNFHIHVPEGAIPKDGPSAGVTITTSLLSLLTNQPVSRDVAMTGEVTLRGKILPIGGLKEKSIAALRSNIKTIFIPKENAKNLEDVPDEVNKKLKIILVSHYDEIFEHLFKAKTPAK